MFSNAFRYLYLFSFTSVSIFYLRCSLDLSFFVLLLLCHLIFAEKYLFPLQSITFCHTFNNNPSIHLVGYIVVALYTIWQLTSSLPLPCLPKIKTTGQNGYLWSYEFNLISQTPHICIQCTSTWQMVSQTNALRFGTACMACTHRSCINSKGNATLSFIFIKQFDVPVPCYS